MKKIIFWGICLLIPTISSVFATSEDVQIFEQLQNDQLTAEDLQFNTFQSCEQMNDVLTDYIKDNFSNYRWWWGIRRVGMPMMAELLNDDVAMESSAGSVVTTTTVAAPMADSVWSNDLQKISLSSTNEFSTTNTQVVWIDEADILKSDWNYLYYYNQKEQKVQIIKSPLNLQDSTIDLSRLEVLTNINLPNTFNWIQMYRQANNLVIIANRWRNNYNGGFLNNWNQVDIIVYDVSNPAKPDLVRFTELDGNYSDSRLIWDKLYVVNQLWVDRYRPMRQWNDIADVNLDWIQVVPKNIDIAYTKNDSKKNFTIDDTDFPYHISVNKTDCQNLYYVLPDKDSVEQFGMHPSFTTVNVIDLSSTENTPDITTAFGTTNTIHMAKDNLYLTQHFYVPWESWDCPENARCIMPRFNWGEHTLIHKFNVIQDWVMYQDSTLANWSPLTQYSMDQGPEGNFRILTSTWSPERATHLYILDKNLTQIWSVENIEPWEEFKSSRYIGDKLYLVTFEATDPLFVIDMVNPSNPVIIGELVIPWFSTYLHPYGPVQNNVQYLLGLGRDTDLNERWWTVQEWIKLDLYKIDYNNKDSQWHVSVTQEYSQTRWWRGSQSEAVYNPRMFVRDTTRKLLVLPMHLMEEQEWNRICESERDPSGNIIREECRNDESNATSFIWMKAISVTPERWIIETSSFDYTHLYKQDKELFNNGWYNTRNLTPRVWYVGDVLYQLNWSFGHFINTASWGEQAFIPLWDTSINFSPNTQTNGWGNSTEPFTVSAMNVASCLSKAGWVLFTSDDCRYCGPQEEVFEDYYAKVEKVLCNEQKEVCSDEWITWYPTWVDWNGEQWPWYKDLESLAEAAWCY